MLSNITKEILIVLLKNAKLKWFKIQNFRKILKCQCAHPQNAKLVGKISCNKVVEGFSYSLHSKSSEK